MSQANLAKLSEIKQGDALREEFAIDDALAEAGDDPESHTPGKFVERGANASAKERLR